MIRAMLCLGLCASVASQRDVADERAFVEVVAVRSEWFVQQPVRLSLRIGLDEDFLRTQVIQPFQRSMDLPVRAESPWSDGVAGAVAIAGEEPTGPTFVLDGELARASHSETRAIDGRQFRVFEVARTFAPTRAGELTLPAPRVRVDYATRFRDDFLSGRVPVDRAELVASGARLVLRIVPLPTEGRPAGFSGAVGRFHVRADAAPRAVRVGESLRLTLDIVAEVGANLASLSAPTLDDLTGFHVFGSIEQRGSDRRTITYDIAPLSTDLTAVPAIRFSFFDPTPPATYRTELTQPIPLAVSTSPNGDRIATIPTEEPRTPVPGVDDVYDLLPFRAPEPAAGGRTRSPILLAAVLFAPWITWLAFAARRRAQSRSRGGLATQRARRAAAAFFARAGTDEAQQAFAEYLAVRLGDTPASVIAADLPTRLTDAGAPAELAARAGTLIDELLAARYSNDERTIDRPRTVDPEGARTLVEELEAAFRPKDRHR